VTYKNFEANPVKREGAEASSAKPKIRIVVADDHPIVREGIVANLKQIGELEVLGEANDGLEALALAKQFHPDIALLDMRMPHMNGLEVLLALNELMLQTKGIIMTAFENEEDIQRSLKSGARAYLLKDCTKSRLVDAIRRVHEGEVYLHGQIAHKLVEWMQRPQLSPREVEVLAAVAAGKSNKEIGVRLFISERTVKTHIESLLDKLGVATRTSAVKAAVRSGLIQMA
jgi:two-component system, NarL family, response regulator